jgi:hypothetical protein
LTIDLKLALILNLHKFDQEIGYLPRGEQWLRSGAALQHRMLGVVFLTFNSRNNQLPTASPHFLAFSVLWSVVVYLSNRSLADFSKPSARLCQVSTALNVRCPADQ